MLKEIIKSLFLISRSTCTAFYSSLDLEVTILFHSSWLLSDLYFGHFLVAFTSSTIRDFPEAGTAVHSSPTQQAQPLPGCTGHPLLGARGPTLLLELQALLSSSLPDSFPRISHGFFNFTDLELNLSFPTNPPLVLFLI